MEGQVVSEWLSSIKDSGGIGPFQDILPGLERTHPRFLSCYFIV